MARTALTPVNVVAAGDAALNTAALDSVNGMEYSSGTDGKVLLYIKNTDGVAAITITIPEAKATEAGDVSISIPANGEVLIGGFESARFEQTGEKIHVDASASTGVIAAINLP